MARTERTFNLDDILGMYFQDKPKVTLLERDWYIREDVPIAVELQFQQAVLGSGHGEETQEERRLRTTMDQMAAIDLVYGEGSYDDLIARGGSAWHRIALYRAMLAYYRGLDPVAEVEAMLAAVFGKPGDPDENAEQAHEDAEGNVERPED